MSDDDYNYSDSFVSDEEPERRYKGTGGRNQKKVYSEPKRISFRNIYASSSKVGNKRSFGTMRGRGGKQQSRSSSQADKPDGVVQRMLSAKNLKINELRNQLEDLQTALRDVKEENKLLKKMQHRQEKALTKYEDTESELPQIMQRHQNEVKTLRENLRKTREKYERTDRYLRDAEDELDKVKSKLKRYKSLADQQNLLEREELQKKNHQMEIDMEERDVKVKELERHINNLNKNHRHELGIEIARNRELQKQIEQLRHQNDDLEKNVKEKEKEIQIKNIYANRARAVPHRLPASYGGTPHDTPPPKPRKRAPSLHDLTPREKVKMYEEKRREEEKKLREKQARGGKTGNAFQFSAEPEGRDFFEEKVTVGPQNERRPQHDRLSSSFNEKSGDSYVKFGSGDSRSRDVFSRRKDDDIHDFDSRPWYENNSDHSSTYRKSNTDKRGRATHHRFDNVNTHAARDYGKPPLPSGNKGFGFKFSANFDQPEQQERARREKEEREQEEMERKRAQEREKHERMEWERQEKERFECDERERREREQREKEEEDWRLTMERERLKQEQEDRDRERREKEERLRKEREEKDRRDRERREQERRAHEEMERKKMDKQQEEERRKKDDLLAKLKQIDDGQNKLLTTNTSKPDTKKEEPTDSFFLTSGRVKDKDTNSLGSATSSKHSYTFTKPVENLHSGKPSREDNSIPYLEKQKKKKDSFDEFGGGYQPSFGGGTTQKPSSKKTSGSVLFNDDFTSTSKAKPKNNKKSNLMADLFGDQTSKSKNDDDDDDILKPTKTTTKSTNVNSTSKSSFLWDDDDSTTTKKPSANKRENSTSALFAGGTAFIEDDVSQKNDSKMLPRRPRQTTTTFAARPAVTAVDHYDDDIEEVIL